MPYGPEFNAKLQRVCQKSFSFGREVHAMNEYLSIVRVSKRSDCAASCDGLTRWLRHFVLLGTLAILSTRDETQQSCISRCVCTEVLTISQI